MRLRIVIGIEGDLSLRKMFLLKSKKPGFIMLKPP